MLSLDLLKEVHNYQTKHKLSFDLESVKDLEVTMDVVISRFPTFLGTEGILWAGYFGELLVHKFEGKWIEQDKVQLFDNVVIDPLEVIVNYVSRETNSSLMDLYRNIHIRYCRSNNIRSEYEDFTEEDKQLEIAARILGTGSFQGFTSIKSSEDFLRIEKNKHRVRLLMAHFEEIYPELKQLKEYQELRQLPLSSDEAKQKIKEIKNIVAEKGDPTEMAAFGFACYDGDGIDQNDEEAWFWTSKAAEKGHVAAMYNLGIFYLNGIGCPEDNEQGRYWLKKSAGLGDEDAKERLREMKEDDLEKSK